MKVDKSKAMNPCEQYEHYYNELFNGIDEVFPWDQHPNQVRAAEIRRQRTMKKMKALVDTEEFKEHNCFTSCNNPS